MDVRPPSTAIHRLVEQCRSGEEPALIARLRSGWAVMGRRQVFAGYCLLLPDPVVPDLNALQGDEREQFLADMAQLGDAVLASTGAVRINYAMFGNVEPALHAHVFPRRAEELVTSGGAHPWSLDWELAAPYSDAIHGDLRRRIAARLTPARA